MGVVVKEDGDSGAGIVVGGVVKVVVAGLRRGVTTVLVVMELYKKK